MMHPLFIRIVISFSHFFVVAGLWFAANRFFPEALFPVFGIYLLIGSISFLGQTDSRQRQPDSLTQTMSYLLGLGILLITLGFVWQCRSEVLTIGIPMVVNNPPRLTALTLGYIATAGFLTYLLTLLPGIRFHQKYPKALLVAPTLHIPIPNGMPQGEKTLRSSPLPSAPITSSPDPLQTSQQISHAESICSADSIPASNGPEEIREKNRLTTHPSEIINKETSKPSPSLQPKQVRGPDILEHIEISRLKKIQEGFSSLTGLSLFSYNADGVTLCEPSSENPICRVVQETPKGRQHCSSHCGKNIGTALESKEAVFFKCDVGLHVFAVPVILNKEDEKVNMAFLGGKTFFNREEFLTAQKVAGALDLPQDKLSPLSDLIRVVDNQTMVSSARFLESVIPYLLVTLYEHNTMETKLTRMMTLFTFSSASKEERGQHLSSVLLNTLGILFGLDTASVMVLDPREKQFRIEAVSGQKTAQINSLLLEKNTGLIGALLEKESHVYSRDTFEILRTGLPAEITSVHFFPLLFRNGKICGILAIYDTPLAEEDVMIISAFCQQIGIHHENTVLRTERQDLTKDISVLLEISKTVGSVLDSEDLFGIILEKSTEFLNAEQGSIMLVNEERKELTVKAMKGLNQKIVELLKIRPGEGISGKVLATGSPIIVTDIDRDERVTQMKRPRYKTNSFISIPLKLNGRTIGVLNVADKITGEVFSEEDLRLLVSIGAYASVAIERSQFHQKTEELKRISITDSLTSLLNRRYFQERMSEEIERSRRHLLPLSLIMMDLDNFKSINDTHGHMIGDEVLKLTARCLRNCIRTIDVAARYGGEEFTIILPQTNKLEAAVIAERVCNEIRKLDIPLDQDGLRIPLTVSVGLATFPDDADNLEGVIRKSDIALYQAKTQGKDRVVIHQKPPES
jgi:diguanylate cyclase (GGDEF)-like protein